MPKTERERGKGSLGLWSAKEEWHKLKGSCCVVILMLPGEAIQRSRISSDAALICRTSARRLSPLKYWLRPAPRHQKPVKACGRRGPRRRHSLARYAALICAGIETKGLSNLQIGSRFDWSLCWSRRSERKQKLGFVVMAIRQGMLGRRLRNEAKQIKASVWWTYLEKWKRRTPSPLAWRRAAV